jgi:hypothetical protein
MFSSKQWQGFKCHISNVKKFIFCSVNANSKSKAVWLFSVYLSAALAFGAQFCLWGYEALNVTLAVFSFLIILPLVFIIFAVLWNIFLKKESQNICNINILCIK